MAENISSNVNIGQIIMIGVVALIIVVCLLFMFRERANQQKILNYKIKEAEEKLIMAMDRIN